MTSVTPDIRLPSLPQSITALWPVPNYTAWWQRHMGCCLTVHRLGVEPATSRSQVRHANHYTTKPQCMSIIISQQGTGTNLNSESYKDCLVGLLLHLSSDHRRNGGVDGLGNHRMYSALDLKPTLQETRWPTTASNCHVSLTDQPTNQRLRRCY